MSARTGRASVNPSDPRAFGICDRCGLQYNHRDLRWQYDWAGVSMINKRILVCQTCLDRPQQQLRTIILPPDPLPVLNARPEAYLIDEANHYTLTKPIGKPIWLMGTGAVTAELSVEVGGLIAAAIGDTSNLAVGLSIGFNAVAAIGDTGAVTADVSVAPPGLVDIAAAIGDTGDIVAAMSIGFNAVAAIGDTGAVTADVTVTGGGGTDELLQEDGSLLLLESLAPIVLNTGIPALSAAGTLTGTEQVAVVQSGVTDRTTLAAVVIKLRGF